MPRIIRGAEFAGRAAESRYPLLPTATARDTSDAFSIPNDFLVGLMIAIPSDISINPTTYHISKIVNVQNRTIVTVSGVLGEAIVTIGKFDVLRSVVRNQILTKSYGFSVFVGSADYPDIRGRLMIGSVDSIAKQPQGSFDFSPLGAGISVDCVRPVFRHLSAINVLAANGNNYRLTGAVRLKGGDNVRLTVQVQDDQPVVVFDAIDAASFSDNLDCDSGSAPSIKTLNGIAGNNAREFTLLGSRCLAVEPVTFGVKLTNDCSEPCATCDEAESLKGMIQPFAQQVPVVMQVASRLESAVSQMQKSMADSQIGCPPSE